MTERRHDAAGANGAPVPAGPQSEEMSTLRALVGDFEHAMLVTRSDEGELRARPMRIVAQQNRGTLVFVTHRGDEKVDEIAASPEVCVTLQDGKRFVSMSGTAVVDDSRDRIHRHFDASWEPWFPGGASDPDIRLIDVTPTYAEYWDGSGLDRLTFLFAAAKAVAKGEALSTDVTEHAKLEIVGRG